MNVIISGHTAAGKTTHCKLLVRELSEMGFEYISASTLLLKKLEATVKNNKPLDYWISDEALALNEKRKEDPTFDKELDSELIETIDAPGIHWVVDVLSAAWLTKTPAISIWLESSLESRAVKALISYQGTSLFSLDEIRKRIALVDKHDRNYFVEHYGFDLFRDKSPFEIVLDITAFTTQATYEASQASISAVQPILSSLVQWKLGVPNSREKFMNLYNNLPKEIFFKLPEQLLVVR